MLHHRPGEGTTPSPGAYGLGCISCGGYDLARAHGRLPTRQVVVVDGPYPPVELVTIAATRSRGCPRRPCPPRARSTGNWRSLTVNNGRSIEALSCSNGVGSGQEDGTGRAFQARVRLLAGPCWVRAGSVNSGSQEMSGYDRKEPQFTDLYVRDLRRWSGGGWSLRLASYPNSRHPWWLSALPSWGGRRAPSPPRSPPSVLSAI